jgi:chromosomal replication initiation ATPase DnaA
MPGSAQIPLALSHPLHYDRESFLVGPSNAAALTMIERWPDWPAEIAVLCGPPGSGKTHLAQIWAERTGARIVPAKALEDAGREPATAAGALLVEDVEPGHVPEKALFHLINMAQEARAGLLLTSRHPPSEWRVSLPDLASRLRKATPLVLQPPDDGLLRTVLVKLFGDRQLIVEKAVIDYLLLRMERSCGAALALVEALDREALASGSAVTRPLAARVLAEIMPEPDLFTEPE